MTPKALVIDDDPDILEVVADILESMGHECDLADSVESARQCLECSEYTYVLLDLEIPVRAGRNLPRIQNGENLLEEIIERTGTQRQPIIVMTAHGTHGHELAVEVMKLGAVDYVAKPFKTAGRTLDKAIREALARQCEAPVSLPQPHHEAPSTTTPAPTSAPMPFNRGTMVFYPDRVELCGAIICDGNRKSERQRNALELFRIKVGARFARYDCDQLAGKVGILAGSRGASGFVRSLRHRIKKALLDQVNIEAQDDDVICYDCGYCLSQKLTVQDGADVDCGQDQGHGGEDLLLDVPNRVPNVPNPHVPNVPDDAAGMRRAWILQKLASGTKLRTADIAKHFKCSRKTAQRTMATLKEEGLVEFVGAPRTGYYRLCRPPEATD